MAGVRGTRQALASDSRQLNYSDLAVEHLTAMHGNGLKKKIRKTRMTEAAEELAMNTAHFLFHI